MKTEVISELDPIGHFKVTVVQGENGRCVIEIKGSGGKELTVYGMDALNELRWFAETRVEPGMSPEEADGWRDAMMDSVVVIREMTAEVFGPMFKELLQEPWYVRAWHAVRDFFIPPKQEEESCG